MKQWRLEYDVTNTGVKTSRELVEVLKSIKDDVEDGEALAGSVPHFYASRAELQAAEIPDTCQYFGYVQDGLAIAFTRGGTAVLLADGTYGTPAGTPYPQHYGALADGATDDAVPLLACIAAHRYTEIIGTVATSAGVSLSNRYIKGQGQQATSRILGLAAMPIDEPIVGLGGQAGISDIELEYDAAAITLAETEGQRVGLGLTTTAGTNATKGAFASNLILNNCGTGIYSDATPFNVAIRNIFVQGFTFRGWDCPLGTGNTFEGQLYLEGLAATEPTHRINSAFNVEKATGKENSGTAAFGAQLNIHLCRANGPLVRIDSLTNAFFGATHIENSSIETDDTGVIDLNQTSITFASLNVQSLGMNVVNPSVFRLRDAEYPASPAAAHSVRSTVTVEHLTVRGLNNPASILGAWSPTGVRNAVGFQYFAREAGAIGEYNVNLPNGFEWAVYTLDDNSDETDVLNGLWRITDPAITLQIGQPKRNWVTNGRFGTWTATSGTSTGAAATELAQGWYIIGLGAAVVTGARVERPSGDREGSYALQFDNIGFPGETCSLQHKIYDVLPLAGQEVTLSFEMMCDTPGQVIEDITCSLDNGVGVPPSTFNRIKFGTNDRLELTTAMQRFEFTFTMPTITTLDPAAFWDLRFRLNVATGTNEAKLTVQDVALQTGPFATQWIEHASAAWGQFLIAGQDGMVAQVAGDALTLVEGANVTLTTNAATKEITIAASGGGGGGASAAISWVI